MGSGESHKMDINRTESSPRFLYSFPRPTSYSPLPTPHSPLPSFPEREL